MSYLTALVHRVRCAEQYAAGQSGGTDNLVAEIDPGTRQFFETIKTERRRIYMDTTLFHVSEETGIERFEPRSIDGVAEPRVWAIDDRHLRNLLGSARLPPRHVFGGADCCARGR